MEYMIGKALQTTGQDLFQLSPVLQDMVTQSDFIQPLAAFQYRLALANAFGTDFQVPTATAAFLTSTDTVHVVVDNLPGWSSSSSSSSREETVPTTTAPVVPLMVQTKRDEAILHGVASSSSSSSPSSSVTLQDMSRRLDAMGWTKIFCDMRHALPSWPRIFSSSSDPTQQQQQRITKYTSQELQHYLSNDPQSHHFPWGHSMMVANSKNDVYVKLNAGGRPVMDALAAHIIQVLVGCSEGH